MDQEEKGPFDFRGAAVSRRKLTQHDRRIPAWASMTANGLSRSGLARGGWDALYLVQPDALAPPAGGFPREISVGLGRHPQFAIRPGARARGLQRLSRPARICRDGRL